ncbi:MAG TPA: serine/threonine-protein kinase, partial [Steroidobacteraceae bacterium]|nr:serine/threonine-protein kinase [Steroidobacteraceae bacterium]
PAGQLDAARWQRVKEVFAAALERDAASRASYLDEACGGDTDLRAEIDSLIAAHETTEDFIEKPAAQRALGIQDAPERSWIGRRIGGYRIVEEVGRGGMSEVYKAIRDDDEYHKEVAVKVLRQGYDTRSLLKRFKAEVQILARLDHPNIARLLDAGSTEEGLPYLVMDYIQGRPIDEYASVKKLDLTGRLALFRKLCGAVQYVHQHLMVHGDLKCNNVLVTEEGAVKLLDFGIARLLNPTAPGVNVPDAKATSFIALTPEYASPEQVRGGSITTASDVYSLGVMLYRLLTSTLPHRIRGDFSYELAKQILESDAKPPSVAAAEQVAAARRELAAAGGKDETAERIATEFDGFARQLRGDLDNIVLMALEKNPAKRYPSVEAFEADIRRHLEGFPVNARSAGVAYRALKFAGRHRTGLAAVSLLIITLVGGIAATAWQARVANAERLRAEKHFDEVRKLANVFMFDIHGAIANLPGATRARQMLVENSLKYLAALSAESGNQPDLQRELASAYEKVGDIQGRYGEVTVGNTPGAIESYRKALALREELLKANPGDEDIQRELLRNEGKLGDISLQIGDPKQALEHARRAATLAEQIARRNRTEIGDQRNLANAYLSQGWYLAKGGDPERGLIIMQRAIALYEGLVDVDPKDITTRRALAIACGRTGEILVDRARFEEAMRVREKGLAVIRSILEEDPLNANVRRLEAFALRGLGSTLLAQGKPDAALAQHLQAVEILRRLFDAEPDNESLRFDMASFLLDAANSARTLRDFKTAERRYMEAVNALVKSPAALERDLNEVRGQLGIGYLGLASTIALQTAAEPGRSDRRFRCEQARSFEKLAAPILAVADQDPAWKAQIGPHVEQATTALAACGAPRS